MARSARGASKSEVAVAGQRGDLGEQDRAGALGSGGAGLRRWRRRRPGRLRWTRTASPAASRLPAGAASAARTVSQGRPACGRLAASRRSAAGSRPARWRRTRWSARRRPCPACSSVHPEGEERAGAGALRQAVADRAAADQLGLALDRGDRPGATAGWCPRPGWAGGRRGPFVVDAGRVRRRGSARPAGGVPAAGAGQGTGPGTGRGSPAA